MPSIILELQHDAVSSSVEVSNLLRKALLIATKLNVPDFKSWIENEVSGYPSGDLPSYRVSSGTVMGQDQWGRWIPALFADSKMEEMVAKVQLRDTVAEIEAIIQRTKRNKEEGAVHVEFAPEQQQILRRNFHDAVRFTRIIRLEDLTRILEAVRQEILNWSLKLERDGIVGEGVTFSPDEQRKASAIHYTTHFHGAVGNVAQNSQHVRQIANIGIRPDDLAKLVKDFGSHIEELSLDSRQKQRAEAQLTILKTELGGEPDSEIVRQAGRTLRNITEGAIGSLLATATTQPGVWHWIQQVLGSL